MRLLSALRLGLAISFATNVAQAALAQTPALKSPSPQFVLLSFDGSKSLDMWEETRAFARDEMNGKVKFTYFISCVYFLTRANRKDYVEPARGAGKSAIGFGADSEDIRRRIDQVNAARTEGHEIASHACGHHSGAARWSAEQWEQEFASFDKFVFGAVANNGLTPPAGYPSGYVFGKSEVTGFRAPLLETSKGLWQTMAKRNYRYDTSRAEHDTYQPKKINGVWNFPLAQVRIAGTAKRTLSMDYNFYYAQSGAKADPDNAARYAKEMLETYLQYFEKNYNGPRAPVHIGHHFSKWNGGAYWTAMKSFARRICSLPDVRCVTNAELADYLDRRGQDMALLDPVPKGFQRVAFSTAPKPYDIDLDVSVKLDRSGKPVLSAQLIGADVARLLHPALDIVPQHHAAVSMGAPTSATLNAFSAAIGQNLAKTLRKDFPLGDGEDRDGQEFRIVLHDGVAEILTQTFSTKGWKAGMKLIPREARALLGDLPEAHLDEGAPDGHPLAIPTRN